MLYTPSQLTPWAGSPNRAKMSPIDSQIVDVWNGLLSCLPVRGCAFILVHKQLFAGLPFLILPEGS